MGIIKSTLSRWQQTNLMLRILGGIVAGSALALIVPDISVISMLGDLFVGALKAIAPVLVAVLVYPLLFPLLRKLERKRRGHDV